MVFTKEDTDDKEGAVVGIGLALSALFQETRKDLQVNLLTNYQYKYCSPLVMLYNVILYRILSQMFWMEKNILITKYINQR